MGVSFAVSNDGGLYASGCNSEGNLGLGDTEQRLQLCHVEIPPVQSIISGSYTHTLALCDGIVYSWGNGYSYQLGHGDENDQYLPTAVESLQDKQIITISAGENFSLFLSAIGEVFFCGQMKVGPRMQVPSLVSMRSVIKEIDAGLGHAVALSCKKISSFCLTLTADGGIIVFGFNHAGELGTGNTEAQSFLYPIQLLTPRNVDKIIAGGHHSFAILAD